MRIQIVNESTDSRITGDVIAAIAAACQRQITEHAAPMWAAMPIAIERIGALADAAPDAGIVHIQDVPDQPGVLGYHAALANGLPYARIFTQPIFSNGGTATGGNVSLSATVSHEIVEAFCDPYASWWADQDDGSEVALEACDPVEGDAYEIDGVSVSNFVGPRWFRDGDGPYDYMGLLILPFTVRSSGYTIVRSGGPQGTVTDVFGEAMPKWKQAGKLLKAKRR